MNDGEITIDLPPGFRLGVYEIQSKLGQGGFGVTYLAKHSGLGSLVAIKEFAPYGEVMRDRDYNLTLVSQANLGGFVQQLQRFREEAQRLEDFNHPNIVRVRDLIDDNNTCYYIMDYIEGGTLSGLVKKFGPLPTTSVMLILERLIDGMKVVHDAGVTHRDIKPANILIANLTEPVSTPLPDIPVDERKAVGRPVLIDFGAARDTNHDGRSATNFVSKGYAPFEQYSARSRPTAQSDIYSLGAVAYYCLGAEPPEEAAERQLNPSCHIPAVEKFADKADKRFLEAIDHALEMKAEDRPESLREWRADLFGHLDVTWEHTRPAKRSGRKRKSQSKRTPVLIALGVIGASAAVGVGVVYTQLPGNNTPPAPATSENTVPDETSSPVSAAKPDFAHVTTVSARTDSWVQVPLERKGPVQFASDGPFRVRSGNVVLLIDDGSPVDLAPVINGDKIEVKSVNADREVSLIWK